MNKKGQQITLSNAPNIIILLLLVVMVGAAAALALGAMQSSQASSATDTGRTTTVTATNASAQTYNSEFNTLGCSSVVVYNGTNNKVVTSEFTLTSAYKLCTAIILAGNNTIQGKTVTVNYTKSRETFSYSYNVSRDGLVATKNLSKQLPTIGTVIGVALIVVVVIGAFAFFIGGMKGGAL